MLVSIFYAFKSPIFKSLSLLENIFKVPNTKLRVKDLNKKIQHDFHGKIAVSNMQLQTIQNQMNTRMIMFIILPGCILFMSLMLLGIFNWTPTLSKFQIGSNYSNLATFKAIYLVKALFKRFTKPTQNIRKEWTKDGMRNIGWLFKKSVLFIS